MTPLPAPPDRMSREALVEKIARALHATDINAIGEDWDWTAYRAQANAAIVAIYKNQLALVEKSDIPKALYDGSGKRWLDAKNAADLARAPQKP